MCIYATRALAHRTREKRVYPPVFEFISRSEELADVFLGDLYEEEELLYNEERPLSKENIIFRRLSINRERRNNIYIDTLTLSLI